MSPVHAPAPFNQLSAVQVWRHTIGSDPDSDVMVYHEEDPSFNVEVALSRSQNFIFIDTSSLLNLQVPSAAWSLKHNYVVSNKLLSKFEVLCTPHGGIAPQFQGNRHYLPISRPFIGSRLENAAFHQD